MLEVRNIKTYYGNIQALNVIALFAAGSQKIAVPTTHIKNPAFPLCSLEKTHTMAFQTEPLFKLGGIRINARIVLLGEVVLIVEALNLLLGWTRIQET